MRAGLLTDPVTFRKATITKNQYGQEETDWIDMISTLDIPQQGLGEGEWGMFRVQDNGDNEWIASPYWDWGAFYVQIARTILSGEWDTSAIIAPSLSRAW